MVNASLSLGLKRIQISKHAKLFQKLSEGSDNNNNKKKRKVILN